MDPARVMAADASMSDMALARGRNAHDDKRARALGLGSIFLHNVTALHVLYYWSSIIFLHPSFCSSFSNCLSLSASIEVTGEANPRLPRELRLKNYLPGDYLQP